MTNGEVLQKTFPNSELDTLSTKIVFTLEPRTLGQQVFVFDKDWWNAEYKELTTKNKAKYCDRNICLKNEYNNIGCEDCEVTKSQEPTAKNNLADEYISRKALMAILSDYYDTTVEYRSMLKEIAALPSVTPQEPKTGKWISTETKGVRYAFWCRYKCPLCGGLSDHTNFCPNCGAKMESEDKE